MINNFIKSIFFKINFENIKILYFHTINFLGFTYNNQK